RRPRDDRSHGRRLDSGGARPGRARPACRPRLRRRGGGDGGARGRAVPPPARGRIVTSVEIPYSIAAALPSLAVLDITNEVAHDIAESEIASGIAYVSSGGDALVRVNEREGGFFHDLEALLRRLVPEETDARDRLLALL